MGRPEPGERVVLPTGSFMQECIVLGPEHDKGDLIAAKTTRQYTTRDMFDWPVRHRKGQIVLFKMPEGASDGTREGADSVTTGKPTWRDDPT